jgi:hypothetical protein
VIVGKELERIRKEATAAEFKVLISRVFVERRVEQANWYSNRNRTGKGMRRWERGNLMGREKMNEDGIWKNAGKGINTGTLDFSLALRLVSH